MPGYSYRLLLSFFFFMALFSCKKDSAEKEEILTADAKMKDSAMAYIHEAYLWYDQIPANFNPRSFANLNNLMTGIRQYSREPGFPNPVDRFSFAVEKEVWDDVSVGSSKDFGLGIFFVNDSELRVRYVERNSPAEKAGIKRGWRITHINNISNISTSNAADIIQAVYINQSISRLDLVRHDGTLGTYTLEAAEYYSDPILLDSIYSGGGKKAGYLVFNSFLGDKEKISQSFINIFNRYAAEGIKEMILDLRYNGGGFGSVQEEFSNFLVPSAANGKLMMRLQYNKKLERFNESINFQKKGNLELNRLYVIVSSSTASASEYLINNLDPHIQIIILGPSASYGKPVGFWPIPVGQQYIFPVSSRGVNSRGEGNYFNGFQPVRQTADAINKNWGDATDPSLAAALQHIQTGSFGIVRSDPRILESRSVAKDLSNSRIESRYFKGTVIDGKAGLMVR
jgi:carboxyl-terminal processing protease